jgi:N-acyl homoserine lactone hydrolase
MHRDALSPSDAARLKSIAAFGSVRPVTVRVDRLRGLAIVGRPSLEGSSMRRLAAITLLVVLLLGAFLSTFTAAPLPPPTPLTAELPPASPPAEMAVFQLPTGITYRVAAIGYRGGSFIERRDFAMAATLVRHPRGDLLIDTGFGRDIDAQYQSMPLFFRLMTPYARYQSAADQLDAAQYDRSRLRGILLTHAHWDHVSGLPDLPGVPVLVTAGELRFIRDGGWITQLARGFDGVRYEEYGFEGGPYLGFPASHDVYGDGSIVAVPAPGHTPGSVIVFLALPDGTRYALVGDLVWQLEGITQREERPWLQRRLADDDAGDVRDNILRMAAISARFPALIIVPAHDQRGFAPMPRLPSRAAAEKR